MMQQNQSHEVMMIKAEIDQRVSTAKAYPRIVESDNELTSFLGRAKKACTLDEGTAQDCMFSLPKGGKEISGPSIRMAEILMGLWGNIDTASRVVSVDKDTVTVEAVALDLETNSKVMRQVVRKHYGDIPLACGAAQSIALRNVITTIVPKAYVNQIYDHVKKFAVGDHSTLIKKRTALFDRFSKMGIYQDKILSFFGHKKIDEITLEDVEAMIGVGTAIKANEITLDEAFSISSATMDKFKESTKSKLQSQFGGK